MSSVISHQQLTQLIYKQIDCAQPAQQALAMTLAQLGIDSLGLVDIALELEQQLEIDLDLDLVTADTTLAEVVEAIYAQQQPS